MSIYTFLSWPWPRTLSTSWLAPLLRIYTFIDRCVEKYIYICIYIYTHTCVYMYVYICIYRKMLHIQARRLTCGYVYLFIDSRVCIAVLR